MKNFFKCSICLVWLFCFFNSNAQEAAWRLSFDQPILWQQVTPLGDLLVNTSDGLYGVDPEHGTIKWKITQLGNLPGESYRILPTSYFNEFILGDRVVVLDPFNGKMIFDSQQVGYKSVLSINVLLESGGLMIYGIKDNLQSVLSCFDIQTGAQRWGNDNIFNNKTKMGSLFAALQTMAPADEGPENAFRMIEVSDGAFIIAVPSGIFKFDSSTGGQVWSADLPQPKGIISANQQYDLIRVPKSPNFYFVKSNYVMAYSIDKGTEQWPDVVKISGLVNEVINHPLGVILLPRIDPVNTGVKTNMVNASTGETLWGKNGKGTKLNGEVSGYYFLNENELALSMGNGENSFLNILDLKTGELKFDKSEKIHGMLDYTELLPCGMLYVTRSDENSNGELNIYDLKTGENKWSKSIRSGKTASGVESGANLFQVVSTEDQVYVYAGSENALFSIDKNTGGLKTMLDKVKLEGKDAVKAIELRENGIALLSDQNIVMANFNGGVAFQKYYPAPTDPGFLKALYGIASVSAALVSASAEITASNLEYAALQTSNSSAKGIYSLYSQAYNMEGDAYRAYSKGLMAQAKKRYKATSASQDDMFMMTRKPDKSIALIRVNKDSGEVEQSIDMGKDKTPMYQVDELSRSVYYGITPKELVCYHY